MGFSASGHSITFDELRTLGAPLEPLEHAQRRLVRARTGKVWHREPTPQSSPHGSPTTCARGKTTAARATSHRLTITVADMAREGIDVCRAYGCNGGGGAEETLASVAWQVVDLIEAFEQAEHQSDWVKAAALHERLEVVVKRPWVANDDVELTVKQVQRAAVCDWAEALIAPVTTRLNAALSSSDESVTLAVGALDTPFVPADMAAFGVSIAQGRAAHAAWRDAVEALDPIATVRKNVEAAIVRACQALGCPAPEGDAHLAVVDHWNDLARACGAEDPDGPWFAVVVARSGRFQGALADSPVSWQAMAAVTHRTVSHRGAQATLVGERFAERVRAAQLTSKESVLVVPADPASFEAVAHTALGLWDRSYLATGPLASAAAAWDAASVIGTRSAPAAVDAA